MEDPTTIVVDGISYRVRPEAEDAYDVIRVCDGALVGRLDVMPTGHGRIKAFAGSVEESGFARDVLAVIARRARVKGLVP